MSAYARAPRPGGRGRKQQGQGTRTSHNPHKCTSADHEAYAAKQRIQQEQERFARLAEANARQDERRHTSSW